MTNFPDTEVAEFESIHAYEKVKSKVEFQVKVGTVREIEPDLSYDFYKCGRWFLRVDNGEIWRLLEPDYGFHGFWEKLRNVNMT